MSSRISIGRPLESTGHPVELLYRMSPRAEDLAQYVHWKSGIPKYVIVLIWMKVPGLTKHCVKTEI